jgi:hypothetical protein
MKLQCFRAIHRLARRIPRVRKWEHRCQNRTLADGACSNRAEVTARAAVGDSAGAAADGRPEQDDSDISKEAGGTWARLLGCRYSFLSAMSGSTCIARRAGIKAATKATAPRMNGTVIKMSGSIAVML